MTNVNIFLFTGKLVRPIRPNRARTQRPTLRLARGWRTGAAPIPLLRPRAGRPREGVRAPLDRRSGRGGRGRRSTRLCGRVEGRTGLALAAVPLRAIQRALPGVLLRVREPGS